MPRYRYHTAILVGPWRESRLKAECDAIAAGQVEFDGAPGKLVWRVPGEIEAEGRSGQAERVISRGDFPTPPNMH